MEFIDFYYLLFDEYIDNSDNFLVRISQDFCDSTPQECHDDPLITAEADSFFDKLYIYNIIDSNLSNLSNLNNGYNNEYINYLVMNFQVVYSSHRALLKNRWVDQIKSFHLGKSVIVEENAGMRRLLLELITSLDLLEQSATVRRNDSITEREIWGIDLGQSVTATLFVIPRAAYPAYRSLPYRVLRKNHLVDHIKIFHFKHSLTDRQHDELYKLYEKKFFQIAHPQSDIQDFLEQEYHLKHVSIICNFKLELLADSRDVCGPGIFYTKKRENQAISIRISIWILTVDCLLCNNRKVMHVKDLRGWFLRLKRRKDLFRPLHKKKQILSLKQKEDITQDADALDEIICQPSFTYVYCVLFLSILDKGNRIFQMEGNSR